MRAQILAVTAAAALLGLASTPALADRDPAYAAARAAGKVGEKPDGYIGIVGRADPALQRVVDNINIKRKAVYSQKALENKATPDAYAFTAGCQAIARTVPGEKYMTPDGSWQTRTSAPPIRDPRCP
ncbi:MAG: YdbL family protein [Erythrobacter sp.]|nr:YdbL family protein [Erythrobacter sp.]